MGGAVALEGGTTVKSVTIITGIGFSSVAKEASTTKDTRAKGSRTTANKTYTIDNTYTTDKASGIIATIKKRIDSNKLYFGH